MIDERRMPLRSEFVALVFCVELPEEELDEPYDAHAELEQLEQN